MNYPPIPTDMLDTFSAVLRQSKPEQNNMIDLKIKKLHPDAILPVYASAGAACFDLHMFGERMEHPTDRHAAVFGTGLSFEVPPGWCMKLYSRSGHGFKNGMRLSNCVGVIDADFVGEVMVSLRTDSGVAPTIRQGDRIVQAKLEPAPRVNFVEVRELSNTARGTGGFGSSGA
jgi:dUTP pyrophosphatase